jgi:hypothetical protein
MKKILDYFSLCERALDDATLMTEVQEVALALMADKRPLAFKAQIDWVIASLPFLLVKEQFRERVRNTVATWRQLLLETPELALTSYGYLLSGSIEGLEMWRLNPEIAALHDQLERHQSAGFALRLSVVALLEKEMPQPLRAELEHLQSLL